MAAGTDQHLCLLSLCIAPAQVYVECAYCGCRRCFPHKRALSSSDCRSKNHASMISSPAQPDG
ncbi:hypothetical protein B5G27_06250 [Lachnoclostridium sp. An76]|nr:hypothetical protein B5G27_06250 [Lachnoclostridium sp. An76]